MLSKLKLLVQKYFEMKMKMKKSPIDDVLNKLNFLLLYE